MEKSLFRSIALAGVLASLPFASAQSPAPPPVPDQTAQPQPPLPSGPVTPGGTVIFSRQQPLDPDAPEAPLAVAPKPPETEVLKEDDPLKVTDTERDALTFTAYDLDVHLTPASAAISVRAGLTVRNDSLAPLGRLVFQISSSLHWDAFSTISASGSLRLDYKARRDATDADHTGWAQEAVVTLPQPLAPGASITLTALYSGAIAPSADRLERIGAPADQAAAADWDAIAAGGTALRGFADVLWYPVAASPVFLGDGAKLFQAAGRARLREAAATVRLRLAVEYVGDPPDAAFFSGRREHLAALSDNTNLPVAEAPGIATAVFDAQPLGFRSLSLFVTDHAPSQVNPSASQTDAGLIAAVTDHYDALPSYSAAAALVEPLLTAWLGARPLTPLNLIDHPGQPFEDDALLVRPMQIEDADKLAPSLAHSLTHAWIHSSHAWIDEGVAQFAGLLWTERSIGRPAALDVLQEAARTLALAEPPPSDPNSADNSANPSTSSSSSNPAASNPPEAAGQSLVDATSDVYYRTKAAAVWWMLRDLTGDVPLQQALQAYRLDPKLDSDPAGFELTLEKFAHKDLRWFFSDWVYRDRGLPDLTIVNVTPRQLEAHNGLPAGWLVAIDVRNDGDAVADVPVTVRSNAGHALGHNVVPGSSGSAATETQRLRIPAHSSVSRRIVFAGVPDEVQVNDGGVPETRTSIHTRQLVLPAK
jgi:hypothetical protein